MEQRNMVFLLALFITLFLGSTIFLLGDFLNGQREKRIDDLSSEMYANLNEMQTFMLMSEIYGDGMACLAFKSKLQALDKSVWDLGIKIDQYRIASEEFQKDPFYLGQKNAFNEKEVFYLMLLSKIKKHCKYDQAIISFFYRNSEDCKKCDDQSFVLTDLKKDAEKEMSIFSFDADLGLNTIKLLTEYYGIDTYPCIVVNDQKYCGMQDKNFIIEKLCETNHLSFCPEKEENMTIS
ncbi:hypothetical protein HY639_03335 [Candidatus Woesearchaeota archaeon]|nr:hypothetical protein [Candidatus Woesearchaeota archaeon]